MVGVLLVAEVFGLSGRFDLPVVFGEHVGSLQHSLNLLSGHIRVGLMPFHVLAWLDFLGAQYGAYLAVGERQHAGLLEFRSRSAARLLVDAFQVIVVESQTGVVVLGDGEHGAMAVAVNGHKGRYRIHPVGCDHAQAARARLG